MWQILHEVFFDSKPPCSMYTFSEVPRSCTTGWGLLNNSTNDWNQCENFMQQIELLKMLTMNARRKEWRSPVSFYNPTELPIQRATASTYEKWFLSTLHTHSACHGQTTRFPQRVLSMGDECIALRMRFQTLLRRNCDETWFEYTPESLKR